MVDLERLDEALDYGVGSPDAVERNIAHAWVYQAARAYRDYLADPVAAAANLDGAVEVGLPDIAMYADDNIVVPAGRYLVIPLPDKETP